MECFARSLSQPPSVASRAPDGFASSAVSESSPRIRCLPACLPLASEVLTAHSLSRPCPQPFQRRPRGGSSPLGTVPVPSAGREAAGVSSFHPAWDSGVLWQSKLAGREPPVPETPPSRQKELQREPLETARLSFQLPAAQHTLASPATEEEATQKGNGTESRPALLARTRALSPPHTLLVLSQD